MISPGLVRQSHPGIEVTGQPQVPTHAEVPEVIGIERKIGVATAWGIDHFP